MKKFYFLLVILLATILTAPGLIAQVPDGFNYQAIARDMASSEPLQNTALDVRIAILSAISPDVVLWEEEHAVVSNSFGLFTIEVGNMSATYVGGSAGSFANIDWSAGNFYLRPSIKQSGGSWELMTPARMISVPFSMLAKDTENKQQLTQSGDYIYLTEGGSVDLSGYVDPDQTLTLSGNTLTLSGGSPIDLSGYINPDQSLTLIGNTLTLSGGSPIDLSGYIDPKQTISKLGNAISLSDEGGVVNLDEYVNQFDASSDTLSKVDGSLVLGSTQANGSILSVIGNEVDPLAPLFEVKNQAGQSVFAVFDNKVEIHVDDKSLTKGSRGGFSVAGFDDAKAPGDSGQDYLLITPDSVRMFIPETTTLPKAPGSRGGFAVGGFDADKKGLETLYFNVSGRSEVDIYNDVPQMLWYPQKEAFQAGRINIPHQDSVGLNSTAFGYHPMAKGAFSQAFGRLAKATGDNSTAIGNQSIARGFDSYAFGSGALALGQKSFALGSIGVDSAGNVMGNPTTASGDYSMALGMSSGATSRGALAIGVDSWSSGWYSTAIGYRSTASGAYSTALGLRANAVGENSMALGMYSYANGLYSLALGSRATATGQFSVAVGFYSQASGDYSVGLGYYAQADADYAYALGRWASAENLYSYALGNSANVTGLSAYALGNSASAGADYSYAMGQSAYTAGLNAYALGFSAQATENYAFAMGYNSVASGESSYAIGRGATASSDYSYSIGWGANAGYYGSIAIGSNAATTGSYSMAFGQNSQATNSVATAIGFSAKSGGFGSTSIGYAADARNNYSVAIGVSAITNGDYAFAIGRDAQSLEANSTSIGRSARARGQNAYAFGSYTEANGAASVGLGYLNIATADSSIVIGNNNTATGTSAISFGNANNAIGDWSVAIGSRTTTSEDRATAIGFDVSANGYKSVSIGANYYKSLIIWIPPIIIFPPIFTKGSEPSKGPEIISEYLPGQGGLEPAGSKQFIILPTFIDRDNDANGSYSVAVGGGNLSENGGFTFGVYNDATAEYSSAIGFANKSTGLYSTSIGFANAAEGNNSLALGKYTTSEPFLSTALGTYNYLSTAYSKTTWVETDPLLQVGNGNEDTPNDAFVIYKNGGAYHEARNANKGLYSYNKVNTQSGWSFGIESEMRAASGNTGNIIGSYSYTYGETGSSGTVYGVYSQAYNYGPGNTYSGYFNSYNYGTGTDMGLWADYRTGTATDLAEYIYDNNEETEAADVVVADENGKENVVLSTKPFQSSVLGIVSTKPHLVMGTELVVDEDGNNIAGVSAVQLALAGRVPCKVTDENGSIKPGDMVTSSSTPGHAMKWSLLDVNKAKDFEELKSMIAENEKRRNAVIGKALESHDTGTGRIIVLISLQ